MTFYFILTYKSNIALIVTHRIINRVVKNSMIRILVVLLLPKLIMGESIVKTNPLILLTKNRGYRETFSQKLDINLFNYFINTCYLILIVLFNFFIMTN